MALSKDKLSSELQQRTKDVQSLTDVASAWAGAVDAYFKDVTCSHLTLALTSKSLIEAAIVPVISPDPIVFTTQLATGISVYLLASGWAPGVGGVVSGKILTAIPTSLQIALVPVFKKAVDEKLDTKPTFDGIAAVIHTYMTSAVVVVGYDSKGRIIAATLS